MDNKIYFKDKQINVILQKVLTGKLRTEVVKIIKEYSSNKNIEMQRQIAPKVMEKYRQQIIDGEKNMADLDKEISDEAVREFMKSEYDLLTLMPQGIDEQNVDLLSMWFNIVQACIDVEETIKGIKTPELKDGLEAVLKGSVKDNWDFWNDQDLEWIEVTQNSFRKKFNITV